MGLLLKYHEFLHERLLYQQFSFELLQYFRLVLSRRPLLITPR